MYVRHWRKVALLFDTRLMVVIDFMMVQEVLMRAPKLPRKVLRFRLTQGSWRCG
jgi:hypothetical protein